MPQMSRVSSEGVLALQGTWPHTLSGQPGLSQDWPTWFLLDLGHLGIGHGGETSGCQSVVSS